MNEEEFDRRMADLIEGPTPEKDAVLDALLERLITGEHGWWTLHAIKALCLVRDQFGPLMEATWHTEGRDDAVYDIGGYQTLLSGLVEREIGRCYPDVEVIDIILAIKGPLDMKADRRAAIYGAMFKRAEQVQAERATNLRHYVASGTRGMLTSPVPAAPIIESDERPNLTYRPLNCPLTTSSGDRK